MVDVPCEGSVECLRCDNEWKGYATAPSADALRDVLDKMLWEHLEVVPHEPTVPHEPIVEYRQRPAQSE